MNKLFPSRRVYEIQPADIPSEKIRSSVSKPLNVVKYNSNGSYFMSAGNDKRVNLWNSDSADHIKAYDAHGYEVTDLAISKDNARFASVGGDKPVFFWDVAAAVTIRRFAGHYQRVNAVALNEDYSVIISGSYDATVRLWDTKSNSTVPIQVLDDAKDSVTAVWVQGHEVVAGSADGKIRTYDLRAMKMVTDVIAYPVTSIVQSEDAQTMLVSSLDSNVRLLDKANGGLLNQFTGHKNEAYRVPSVFGHTQRIIVSGSENGEILAWNIADGSIIGKVQAHAGKVISGVTFHPKAPCMITCGQDGSISLWST